MSSGKSPDSKAATGWPLVSVVVAVYNGGRYLSSALDSVFAQDYRPLEVILVDDGSTDDTVEVARSYPEVRILCQSNQGVAAARNAGIAAAIGDFLAFVDADDLWALNKLAAQVGHLLAHPEVDGTVGLVQNFLNGTPPGASVRGTADRTGLMTLVARRDVFRRVGIFAVAYRVGSDMEWFSRARDAGATIQVLPCLVLYRRIHGGNLSGQADARKASTLRIFRQSIERKRKQ